jgi:hypothetical protein
LFGWQKPCYLLQDGYAETFQELMDSTDWDRYGTESGNSKCANCMVHSGYEAPAVDDTFSSWGGLFRAIRAMVRWRNDDPEELLNLDRNSRPSHAELVQLTLASSDDRGEEVNA